MKRRSKSWVYHYPLFKKMIIQLKTVVFIIVFSSVQLLAVPESPGSTFKVLSPEGLLMQPQGKVCRE